MRLPRLGLILLLLAAGPAVAADEDAPSLFAERCAVCHGAGRLGAMGPALLPEALGRMRPEAVAAVIRDGRPATRMPAFGAELAPEAIAALARYVLSPAGPLPPWGMAEIAASRTVLVDPASLPAAPVFAADPLNLFVVVEAGDHHLTILDGDRFVPLARLPTRFALHGGPKFSPDGRFVYLMSRDGWITRLDLYSLQPVAEVRAGINSRNIALSADGRVIAVANYLPRTLVLLDAATLAPLQVIPAQAATGGADSRVSAVYQAAPRGSFIAALKDLPEVWEIADAAGSGFALRRIPLAEPLDDFFFDPDYRYLVGSARDGSQGVVLDLDRGVEAAKLALPGLPHLGSGIVWQRQGRQVMATTHLKDPVVTVIDLASWQVVRRIEVAGPGFFLRGHEASPYVWADVSLGSQPDIVQVVDKESLEVVASLQPAPGKPTGHVEFTRDGRFALLSVSDLDGALVVYDARTLVEVARLPMRKPVGKYNVGNKIGRSEGTSH